jgi:hypothetical protein
MNQLGGLWRRARRRFLLFRRFVNNTFHPPPFFLSSPPIDRLQPPSITSYLRDISRLLTRWKGRIHLAAIILTLYHSCAKAL